MTASARNSSALAIWPTAVSPCRAGTRLPIDWNGSIVAGADEHGEEDAGERAAGDQPRAEQRAGADFRFLRDCRVFRSTHQRTRPPAKIGAVVAIGR